MAVTSAHRLSRRERELSLRKEIVFEAAEEVFATKGYYEAGVEEIANRAGVSVGTFYNLFGSKETLYVTLIEQRLDDLIQHVRVCLKRGDHALDQLNHLLTGLFEYIDQHQALLLLYVVTTHGLPWHIPSDMGDAIFAKYQELFGHVTAVCQRGQQEKTFQGTTSPSSLALAILGVANAFLTAWIVGKKEGSITALLPDVHTHVQRLVLS
jgi:AcrR family transcriptional regulator